MLLKWIVIIKTSYNNRSNIVKHFTHTVRPTGAFIWWVVLRRICKKFHIFMHHKSYAFELKNILQCTSSITSCTLSFFIYIWPCFFNQIYCFTERWYRNLLHSAWGCWRTAVLLCYVKEFLRYHGTLLTSHKEKLSF